MNNKVESVHLIKGSCGALLLTGALLLCACSPGAEESPSATTSESIATPTPTPTADPNAYAPATKDSPAKNVPKPVMPEAAKQETDEGRDAAIYYLFEMMDYTIMARDPEALIGLADGNAVYPVNTAAISGKMADEGTHVLNPKRTITYLQISPTINPQGLYEGFLTFDTFPFELYKDGKLAQEPAPAVYGATMSFTMFWKDGKWYVYTMEAQKPSP